VESVGSEGELNPAETVVSPNGCAERRGRAPVGRAAADQATGTHSRGVETGMESIFIRRVKS
jgi:hypothetical protein